MDEILQFNGWWAVEAGVMRLVWGMENKELKMRLSKAIFAAENEKHEAFA